jgi:hypothetical protein
MFPLVRVLALIAMCGGGATLYWYEQLSEEKRKEADRIACAYAKELFNKSLADLTSAQSSHVAMLTKQHFAK